MAVEKTIGSTSLAEVIDRILDKGIVVDAWVRLSLVGIEILALEARVVVALYLTASCPAPHLKFSTPPTSNVVFLLTTA